MTDLPAWFDPVLFPFRQRFVDVDGARIHYVDEGEGPVLLMLHGNPTWSFLYRRMIGELADRFRCVALDYPGFGLSTAPPGYGYTPAEHARMVEGFVETLDLTDLTPVVQDWGGPIGMAVAGRHPDRIRAVVVGNSWAWPLDDDATARRFSKILGTGWTGRLLVDRLNVFVNVFIRQGMRRRSPSKAEMRMWRGPFPTPESRFPVRVFPREIIASSAFLSGVAADLPRLADRPTLILWADKDVAFREAARRRWEEILPLHRTHVLAGAGHYWQDDAGEEAALALRRWWEDTF